MTCKAVLAVFASLWYLACGSLAGEEITPCDGNICPARKSLLQQTTKGFDILRLEPTKKHVSCNLTPAVKAQIAATNFSMAGFNTIQAYCCPQYMKEFIRNYVEVFLKMSICQEGGLVGFTMWFYCPNKQNGLVLNNWTDLITETDLTSPAVTNQCPWMSASCPMAPECDQFYGTEPPCMETSTTTTTTTKNTMADDPNAGITNYLYYPGKKMGTTTNLNAAAFNPMKGMCTSPNWVDPSQQAVDSSMDYYYLRLADVWPTSCDATISACSYNSSATSRIDDLNAGLTSYLEPLLEGSRQRARHAILRFIMDYPSKALPEFNAIPQWLLDNGLPTFNYTDFGGGKAPDYRNPYLLEALEVFISTLGSRYDGDRRIGFIQLGLLGFWGEFHTWPHSDWLPYSSKKLVIDAFANAFNHTQLQVRIPAPDAVGKAGMGMHDDSFAHSTLDGTYNGGVAVPWFFWPSVKDAGWENFWHSGVMGGELRPELQTEVFKAGYPAGTEGKQDFDTCVKTTHATWLLNNAMFSGYYTTTESTAAQTAQTKMGYNYAVPEVKAYQVASSNGKTNAKFFVDIENIGVAPFYYPLNVTLHERTSLETSRMIGSKSGVNGVMPGAGYSKVFEFDDERDTVNVATVRNFALTLDSNMLYENRPMRFAQGEDFVASSFSTLGRSAGMLSFTIDFEGYMHPNTTLM